MLSHMRTTLNLPDDLYREVKTTAAATGVTVTSYVEEALREFLRRNLERPTDEEYRLPPPFGGGGTLPGVDINDNAGLLDIMAGR